MYLWIYCIVLFSSTAMTKKAIGLADFENLSLKEQLDLLHTDGVHIGKRVVEGQPVILYQLNEFYAEVYFTDYRKAVGKIVTSAGIEIVHPYIDQVRIRDLDKEL